MNSSSSYQGKKNTSNKPALLQAMIDAFRVPDLRFRILFTLGILVIFRFFAHVPVPGVNRDALASAFQSNPLLGFWRSIKKFKYSSFRCLPLYYFINNYADSYSCNSYSKRNVSGRRIW